MYGGYPSDVLNSTLDVAASFNTKPERNYERL